MHTIRTFEPWDGATLDGPRWISILFSARGAKRDRHLLIQHDGSVYTAEMSFAGEEGPGEPIGEAEVARPTPYTIEVRFPKRFLKPHDLRVYHWRVLTSYEEPGDEDCPESASNPGLDAGFCLDYAPDLGLARVRHRIK